MAILTKPAQHFPGSNALEELIERFNLVPHDKKQVRATVLHDIARCIQSLDPKNASLITGWIKESTLEHHLDKYKVKHDISTPLNFKAKYQQQIATEPDELDNKPRP